MLADNVGVLLLQVIPYPKRIVRNSLEVRGGLGLLLGDGVRVSLEGALVDNNAGDAREVFLEKRLPLCRILII